MPIRQYVATIIKNVLQLVLPQNPARVSRECCKLSQWGPGQARTATIFSDFTMTENRFLSLKYNKMLAVLACPGPRWERTALPRHPSWILVEERKWKKRRGRMGGKGKGEERMAANQVWWKIDWISFLSPNQQHQTTKGKLACWFSCYWMVTESRCIN